MFFDALYLNIEIIQIRIILALELSWKNGTRRIERMSEKLEGIQVLFMVERAMVRNRMNGNNNFIVSYRVVELHKSSGVVWNE